MKKNSNLDERQEQTLLRIEHNGCWLAFWGLLAARMDRFYAACIVYCSRMLKAGNMGPTPETGSVIEHRYFPGKRIGCGNIGLRIYGQKIPGQDIRFHCFRNCICDSNIRCLFRCATVFSTVI